MSTTAKFPLGAPVTLADTQEPTLTIYKIGDYDHQPDGRIVYHLVSGSGPGTTVAYGFSEHELVGVASPAATNPAELVGRHVELNNCPAILMGQHFQAMGTYDVIGYEPAEFEGDPECEIPAYLEISGDDDHGFITLADLDKHGTVIAQ